jgi:hypothetical protein
MNTPNDLRARLYAVIISLALAEREAELDADVMDCHPPPLVESDRKTVVGKSSGDA